MPPLTNAPFYTSFPKNSKRSGKSVKEELGECLSSGVEFYVLWAMYARSMKVLDVADSTNSKTLKFTASNAQTTEIKHILDYVLMKIPGEGDDDDVSLHACKVEWVDERCPRGKSCKKWVPLENVFLTTHNAHPYDQVYDGQQLKFSEQDLKSKKYGDFVSAAMQAWLAKIPPVKSE
jgi:hypothetical protein